MFNTVYLVSLAIVSVSVLISYILMNTNTELETMAKNGLVFVANTAKMHNLVTKAIKSVKNILYIKINSDSGNLLPILSNQIVNIYSNASSQNTDVRLLLKPIKSGEKIHTNHAIDLILYESELDKHIEELKHSVNNLETGCKVKSFDSKTADRVSTEEKIKTYEYVAVGGTFDRLHNGHKILLSQAALRATRHVTVGVTDVNMIKSKVLWELIEPVEKRIKGVLDFLTDINPDLEYNVTPIQDLYGPTKSDPRYELIVTSEETKRGGVKINEKREEIGFRPLDTYVIGLAEDPTNRHSAEEETKVSSSNQRMRLLGTVIKEPEPNPRIPVRPYVIGLAGGIGSGKSNIAEKLKLKGAAVINCDLIAHELYKPGLPLNRTLSEAFGGHIITENGEVDRRKLGQIVFSDKNELERLNQLVWPAVIEETQRRIRALGQAGYEVVVMEAAVMVRAKWYHYCHQLWAVIVPPNEAIKRLQARNNLSEEEARQRVEAQVSNSEQVAAANIVFSPYWSYEYTQSQIDKAWDHLQKYLGHQN
ncbi:PREDICTED: bifunctional coenzyme A synthase isoform X2 [Papilio polytes]|uniref:bifunctional coenzyme A synthase isoform X2 n=1 Tax=Papilio polytes TaxID=76194 RepID=UPI00067696C3|nr:PREDICTED: bifunctional coenzyme A synthase isoform X2 [Papilio polytes]